jgi:hypothetical protein
MLSLFFAVTQPPQSGLWLRQSNTTTIARRLASCIRASILRSSTSIVSLPASTANFIGGSLASLADTILPGCNSSTRQIASSGRRSSFAHASRARAALPAETRENGGARLSPLSPGQVLSKRFLQRGRLATRRLELDLRLVPAEQYDCSGRHIIRR